MGKIVVNSNTLRNYAERISALNKKISNLDSRLKKLFIQSGIVDLAMLIKEDTLLKQSARLSNCQNYLLRTASRFDGVEKTVSSSNLKKSTLVGAGKGGAWAGVAFLSQIAVYSDKLKSGLNVGNDVFFRSAVIKNGITGYINILESIKSPKDKLESAISWMNNMRKSISKDDNYVKHISELDQSLLNAVAAAVNYRKVNTTVESLKELLNQCEITYKKKIEELAADDGRTLVLFGALISNAIHSLSQSNETIGIPEKDNTAAFIGAAASDDVTWSSDDSTHNSGSKGNNTITDIPLGSKMELDNVNIGQECSDYAHERFKTVYGVNLVKASGNKWLSANEGREDITIVKGNLRDSISKLTFPCLVSVDNGTKHGHVFILEGVTYNENGTVKDVYYSESNSGYYKNFDGTGGYENTVYNGSFDEHDGILQRMSFDLFLSKHWLGQNIVGFICPKQ